MKYKKSRTTIVNEIRGADGVSTAYVINMLLEKAKWPSRGDKYWLVTSVGDVSCAYWLGKSDQKVVSGFGNYFRTKKEAIKARDKIREVLKK